MGNPAQQLLDLFTGWNREGRAQQVRGLSGNAKRKARRSHIDAMLALDQLSREIDHLEAQGRAVEPYRRHFPAWVDAVLSHPHGWTDPGTGQRPFNGGMWDALVILADILQSQDPPVPRELLPWAGELADDVERLLTHDASIPSELRTYLGTLTAEIRRCMSLYETTGQFELKEAIHLLWVAVQAAESRSDEPTRWEKVRDKYFVPAAVAWLANAPQTAVAISQIAGT